MLHCSLHRLGLIALASLGINFASVTPAMAVTYSLVTTLNGAQAGTPSGASGSGTLSFDDVSNNLAWNISFEGLLGTESAAHFHGPAPAGVNAGVQITLPLGSPITGSAVLSAAQETDLLNGLWYVNIHSSLYGGGEIRGQLLPVPEPAAYASLLAGLALIGVRLARRKRHPV